MTLDYIPSEIDDSDYVLITVQDDEVDKSEKAETISVPIPSSTTKSPILRSKSSPHKTKKEDLTPVARRHSGTAEKRNRPRSNAISENQHLFRYVNFCLGPFVNYLSKHSLVINGLVSILCKFEFTAFCNKSAMHLALTQPYFHFTNSSDKVHVKQSYDFAYESRSCDQ